jgi:hypothetical protein
MRLMACLLVIAATSTAILAQVNSINFNLVQVNHYNGDQKVQDSVKTPGQRVVIDINNPESYRQMLLGSPSGQLNVAPVVVNVATVTNSADAHGSVALPWESETILRSPSGIDSFKVTSSRAGCPGTEIKPSVSVAFSTPHGWSDPPIRFGPLGNSTMCALGKGYVLDVSVRGDSAPRVALRQQTDHYSQR